MCKKAAETRPETTTTSIIPWNKTCGWSGMQLEKSSDAGNSPIKASSCMLQTNPKACPSMHLTASVAVMTAAVTGLLTGQGTYYSACPVLQGMSFPNTPRHKTRCPAPSTN